MDGKFKSFKRTLVGLVTVVISLLSSSEKRSSSMIEEILLALVVDLNSIFFR